MATFSRKWEQTEDVATDFEYYPTTSSDFVFSDERNILGSVEFNMMETANFSDYDLECFLSKMNFQIRRKLNVEWSPSIVPMITGQKVNMILRIYRGSTFVPITRDMLP